MEKIKVMFVVNDYGVKVKRCCASCQHKCIERTGTRVCSQMMIKVDQRFKCRQWKMNDVLINAGKSGGVVRNIRTKQVVID